MTMDVRRDGDAASPGVRLMDGRVVTSEETKQHKSLISGLYLSDMSADVHNKTHYVIVFGVLS